LRDLYARCLCAHNIGIALTWRERFDEAVTWLDRARELAREISPLAEASVLVVKADTLLEAGRPHDAEKVMLESDAIAGSLPSSIRDTDIIRAALESTIGNHAQALDRHGRALTRAELAGDQAAIQVIVVSLVRAFTRAGREREMLETAGVAKALATSALHAATSSRQYSPTQTPPRPTRSSASGRPHSRSSTPDARWNPTTA